MIIRESNHVPNDTYFRTGDVSPEINDDGSLTIYDGEGTRRSSWGTPGVTSTVILNDCDLVAIHVGFHHKHGGGQFWRYYTTDGKAVRRITWGNLPDEARQKVLDAAGQRAPHWAKSPGKLRSQYQKPSTAKRTTYKLVRKDGDDLRSLYSNEPYTIGKRLSEAVPANAGINDWGDIVHSGGYYSHPSIEQVRNLWQQDALVPSDCYESGDTLALIECEISGRIIKYPNGKLCSTYLTPLRIVETIEVQPELETA